MPESSCESLADSEANLWNNYRLPDSIYPVLYILEIFPDLETGLFSGDVFINIIVTKSVKNIILHSYKLDIKSTRVQRTISDEVYGEDVEIKETFIIEPRQYFVISLKNDIKPGNYTVRISYSGTLSKQTMGLYKSSYLTPDNRMSSCILSYFEPTYARLAFPCFDEPAFKAKFIISLVRPSEDEYKALSNMNQIEEIIDYPVEGVTTTKFASTYKMSTYLVCFVVGIFSHQKPVVTKEGFPVTVYSQPSQLPNTKIARDLAGRIMDFYAEFLSEKYLLPKLDIIGIPESQICAMENWGLLTFRESRLLLQEGGYSIDNFQRLIELIAHELAHMWFGNLVTISWWSELWLKEGMATFLSSLAGASIFPDWYQDWTMILYHLQTVLKTDATVSVHKLVNEVTTPLQIRQIFDVISYKKGACIIRMLYNINPKKFQKALQSYLCLYKYKTAKTIDLWNMFSEQMDNISVSKVMSTWTSQEGFPIVSVNQLSGAYGLSQKRFFSHKNYVHKSEFLWDIPIKYISSQDSNPSLIWLTAENPSITINESEGTSWIKFNWHQIGYFRVNYTVEQWLKFADILQENPKVLDPEDRANLIDDAFSLASATYISYDITLQLVSYLGNGKEDHFLPWCVAHSHLKDLNDRLAGTPAHPYLLTFISKLLKSSLSNDITVFSSDTPFIKKKLQLELVTMACIAKVESVLEKIKALFDLWLQDPTVKPHPELREIIYKYGIHDSKWETVWNLYVQEKNVPEKTKLLTSLTYIENQELLIKLIKYAEQEELVRFEAFLQMLCSISKHPSGNSIVWDYIRKEWSHLVNRFTLHDCFLGSLIPTVTTFHSTPKHLRELREFLHEHSSSIWEHTTKNVCETVETNIEWQKVNYEGIELWLSNFVSGL